MPAPTNREHTAEAATPAAQPDELVSKHSYAPGQTPPNPDTTRQGEQPTQNENTFVAPKAPEPQEASKTPQKLPRMFTDPGRVEWMTQNESSGAVATQTVFKRFFAPQKTPPQPPEEPQEEDNALGCSEAVDAPDGGQGMLPSRWTGYLPFVTVCPFLMTNGRLSPARFTTYSIPKFIKRLSRA